MSEPRRWNRSARSCTSSSRRRHAPGEDAARPGAPYRIAAEKLTAVFGLQLTEQQANRLSLVCHYGLAIQWAPLYPLLRRRTRLGPAAAGLTTGAAMSVVADELMTPAFGFSAPNLDYPLVTLARGFLAHLVFGLAAAAVIETGWKLTGTPREPQPDSTPHPNAKEGRRMSDTAEELTNRLNSAGGGVCSRRCGCR